jgi:pyruvate/2-oxoglutarate dehydrogenase complex dihydrolipoamide acyltransferase (E2) component
MSSKSFYVVNNPSSRVGTFDVVYIGNRTHHVAGLVEVDVTEAQRALAAGRPRQEKSQPEHTPQTDGTNQTGQKTQTPATAGATAQGSRVSFFTWMVKQISDTVARNSHVQAMRGRRGQLVVFDEVDACVILERALEGTRVPLPLVIRRANRKSAEEIQAEIRDAQVQPINNERDWVLSKERPPS